MFSYNYLILPLIASVLVGIFTGLISPLVILRKASFTSHILGHTSMTGYLIGSMTGLNPILSQSIINIVISVLIALRPVKVQDLHIGVLSNIFLGIGIFLLYQYQKGFSGSGMHVFYGSILTISRLQLISLCAMCAIFLLFFIFYIRWYLFYLIEPGLSQIYLGVNSKLIDIYFHVVLALVVTMSCQVIGSLLIFTLLIGPGAIALQWSSTFKNIFLISTLISTMTVLGSMYISCYLYDIPLSFCATVIVSIFYLIGYLKDLKRYK